MARSDFPRTVLDFHKRFARDEACLKYMIDSRWPDGFVCQSCGMQDAYWLPRRSLFQCKGCKHQTSVTAGTVMHRTKIPLPTWFWAAYLVTTHTPGMSALQFQRQSGIGRYETAFTMLHKLRAAMVREDRDKINGTIEVDESYVGGEKEGPAGRGAKGKAIVIAAVEVRRREEGEGTFAGRLRLGVIPNVTGKTLCGFVVNSVKPGARVKTDGWAGYNELSSLGYIHLPRVEGTPERAAEILPHVHRVFSNLKSWLIGTHHGVSPHHLPAYLNEYVFRFNRRGTPMAAFQTVLGLAKERPGPTRNGLYGIAKGEKDAWRHPGA